MKAQSGGTLRADRARAARPHFALTASMAWILAAALIAVWQSANARLDTEVIGQLYESAILEDGGIDSLVDRYRTRGATADTVADRAEAWLTAAHFLWRHGRMDEALASADRALELARTVDGTLLKARLLDAGGAADEAVEWYELALAETVNAVEREFIRIRLTMIEVDERNVSGLVALALDRGQAFRNRAAVALALLGRPDLAINLYRPIPGEGSLYRQHLRRAEWALRAAELALAQESAWAAWEAAVARTDLLYALAVLSEAYREDAALSRLIEDIDDRASADGRLDPDLLQLRVELLIETERYDDAIDFYESLDADEADTAARQRLLGLYISAGQSAQMIAEYRRLMAAEPAVTAWYAGLAGWYMNNAQPDAALAVWQELEEANAADAGVLVAAAELMLTTGFVTEATSMVERHLDLYGDNAPGLLFLFETWLARGRDAEALAAIQRLRASLSPGAADLRSVADGYERLNRHADAVVVYRELEASEGTLGYDERMRLAWLYSVIDEKESALALWQEIWVDVDSPARRTFAESQFLLLAAELNRLGDVVVELEDKLYRRTANRNDINLLVRIYTEVGDTFSAGEVIDEYAAWSGGNEVDRLTQLGRVFLQLDDYNQYDRVLRRLERIDPANRIEHIQNIILNMLAFDLAQETDARFDEIQHWLGELRRYDEEAISGEFEASILSMGGFTDDAIETYRRALVERPEHSDNLLLMADLMREAGRTEEAVALLQYTAEHALDDNEFVVAVDGIINMIGQRAFGEELSPEARGVFRWTHRIILERLTGRADQFYLYTLLADIAQETNASEAEFIAVESSLPLAAARRSAVLRELVTMATPGAGFGLEGGNLGDPQRQIAYGRRLIGLRQQLPPEVFITVGEALLGEGDTRGAERAFDLIDDITGMVDVNHTKAELFLEAGFADYALNYFNNALNLNRDDLELLLNTAVVRESLGSDEVANRLYFRALGNLLRSQPAVLANSAAPVPTDPFAQFRQPVDTSVNRDYRIWYEPLVQGFILTWPADPEESSDRTDEIKAWFDEELVRVLSASEHGEALPLSRYSRLEHLAGFMRRINLAVPDSGLAAYADVALLEHFGDDVEYIDALAQAYRGWTPPEVAAVLAAEQDDEPTEDVPLLAAALQAELEGGDFATAVKLAYATGNVEALSGMFRDRIAAGSYREGLGGAREMLPDTEYLRFISSLAAGLRENRSAFLELLANDPELVTDLEQRLGRELITLDELEDILVSPEAQPVLARSFFAWSSLWRFVGAERGLDDRVRFLQVAAALAGEESPGVNEAISGILEELLAVELSSEQQEDVISAMESLLAATDMRNEYSHGRIIRALLALDAHPGNRRILFELADYRDTRTQGDASVRRLLEAFFGGSIQRAYEELFAFFDLGLLRGFDGASKEWVYEHFEAPHRRVLDAIERGDAVPANLARAVYEVEFNDFFSPADTVEMERMLVRLIDLYPQDDRYRREMIALELSEGDREGAEVAMADYLQFNPADDYIRAALVLHLKESEKYSAALAAATGGGADLRDPEALDALVDAAVAERSFGASSAALLVTVSGSDRYDPLELMIGGLAQTELDRLRELAASGRGTEVELARSLRSLWRNLSAHLAAQDRGLQPGHNPYVWLLGVPLDPDVAYVPNALGLQSNQTVSISTLHEYADAAEPETLLASIAHCCGAELEAHIRSMDVGPRRLSFDLYGLIADAYDAGGEGSARLDELAFDLRRGVIDDHGFTLWMLLRERSGVPLEGWETQALAVREAPLEGTLLELLAAARLYATAGDTDRAVERYQLLAARQLGAVMAENALYFSPNDNAALIDLTDLIDEAAQRLPRTAVLGLARSILAIAEPPDNTPVSGHYYDAFVLTTLSRLLPADEALAEAQSISPNALELNHAARLGEAVKAVELARLYSRSGLEGEALAALRTLLVPPPPETEEAAAPNQVNFQYRRASALAAVYGHPVLDYEVGYGEPPDSMVYMLNLRDRLFPTGADGEMAWWLSGAANAVLAGLEGTDPDAVLATVLVIAWQLNESGRGQEARDLVLRAAEWMSTHTMSKRSAAAVAAAALRVGVALPTDLVKEVLIGGSLTPSQKASLIAALAEMEGSAITLEIVREADPAPGELAVMRALLPLADAAGDMDYATVLRRRIEAAEQARETLVASVGEVATG